MDDHTLRDYASLGWSVFPVKGSFYGRDYEDSKHPLVQAWEPYQYRKPTVNEIDEWEQKWPKASVGAVMGAIAGAIAVDLDSNDWVVHFPNADFGETIKAATKRGCHYFYQWEDWLLDVAHTRAALNEIKGLDLRGQGGYVVVPNTNDAARRWVIDPWTSKPEKMPDWLREFLQVTLTKKHKQSTVVPSALKDISEGNRHQTFVSYIGRLHKRGFSPDEIKLFLEGSAERCGYGQDLLTDIADVTSRYPGAVSEPKDSAIAVSIADIHDQAVQELRQRQEKGIEFKTYFATLDDRLSGLRRSELVSIGAYTSHGKSLLAGSLALKLADQGKVCYFTTEMSKLQFYTLRIMPWLYVIHSAKLRRSNLEGSDWDKLKNKSDLSLWLCDKPSPTLSHIASVCDLTRPDILIVDHLNRCRTEKAENKNLGLAEFLIGIKTLALEMKMVVIVTAQLNRASQVSSAPGLFHFRDSGAIEMESDVAILLDRKDETGDVIDATIAKNRHGPKAVFTLKMDIPNMLVTEERLFA